MRSIEFHKQLGDEKVIPAKTLLETLNHFAESDFEDNEAGSKIEAHAMVNTTTNWGSIRYNNPQSEVLLSYSPWEYVEYDNLLNGSVTVEDDISSRYDPKEQPDLKEKISRVKYFDPVFEEKEIASIQIPADPHTPENYTEDLSDLANSL